MCGFHYHQLSVNRVEGGFAYSTIRYPQLRKFTINSEEVLLKELASHLKRKFSDVYVLSPRRFEQLVGQIYADMGYKVRITKNSRDGGVDLILLEQDSNKQILVQCKRYTVWRKISVSIIREMLVIISYSTDDEVFANQVREILERCGIACWIAPRDVAPGAAWDEAILDAIETTRAMVLILSEHANASPFVENEVNRAFARNKTIFTFRAHDVEPGKSLEFYLARHHWLDGFPPPVQEKAIRLANAIAALLSRTVSFQPLQPSPSASAATDRASPVTAQSSERVPSPAATARNPSPALIARMSSSGAVYRFYGDSVVDNSSMRGLIVERGDTKLELLGTSAKTAGPIAPERGSWVRNLAVVGRYAYVIAPNEGVRIHDVANPESPKLVSVIPYPYDPAWFEPLGKVGILRASSAGVQLVDLSNPVDPKIMHFDNFHNVRFKNCGLALLTAGTMVIDLCHNEECGVRLFDFTDPAAVADVGTIHYAAGTATFHRNYLILGSYKEPSIKAVELMAGSVREMEKMPLDTEKGSIIPKAIRAVTERLYVIGERSLRPVLATFGLEDFPRETRAIGELEVDRIKASFGLQMTQDGHWLCLAVGGRVTVYDVMDVDNPIAAATLDGPFQAATVLADRVYASDARHVWIYRIEKAS